MAVDGWYYLHVNGDVIFKRDFEDTAADLRESTFVVAFWPVEKTDRENAWTLLVEALTLGARLGRIQMLAKTWFCDDADALIYAERIGVNLVKREGEPWRASCMNRIAAVQATLPVGSGTTAVGALSDLCKKLGFKPSKTWGHSFPQLVRVANNATEASFADAESEPHA